MQIVSATDLARNTREILDKVSSSGESVAIERNQVTVAHLVPPEPMMTAAQALVGLKGMLTRDQAAEWLEDSRNSFDETVNDPWG